MAVNPAHIILPTPKPAPIPAPGSSPNQNVVNNGNPDPNWRFTADSFTDPTAITTAKPTPITTLSIKRIVSIGFILYVVYKILKNI